MKFYLGAFAFCLALPSALMTAVQAPPVDALTKTRLELAGAAEQLASARAALSLCQGQLAATTYRDNLQEVAAERRKILDAFEAANPGYTLDLKTLAVTKKTKGGSDGR